MSEEETKEQPENKEEPIDASFEYEKRLKKFKPFTFALLILIGLGILSPFALYTFNLKEFFPFSLILTFFPLVLSFWPVYQMNKCPVCGKYMGRILGTSCPHCKAILRKEEKN